MHLIAASCVTAAKASSCFWLTDEDAGESAPFLQANLGNTLQCLHYRNSAHVLLALLCMTFGKFGKFETCIACDQQGLT